MAAARLNEVPVQTGRPIILEFGAAAECRDLKKTENKKGTLMMRKKARRNQKRGKAMQSVMPTIRGNYDFSEGYDNSKEVLGSMVARVGSASLMGTQCSAGAGESGIAPVDPALLMATQGSARTAENMVGSASLMGTQSSAKVAGRIGGQLGMLMTIVPEEINSTREDGWEELEFAVDSGGK